MDIQQIKIGFIGASKTGTVIANYFKYKGLKVVGFYSISLDSLNTTISLTNTYKFSSIQDLVVNSDLIFITVKDDYLSKVYAQIEFLENIKNKFFCHCSGLYPANLFKQKFNCGSIHPIYTFNNKNILPEKLNNLTFALEGDNATLNLLKQILNLTQNSYFILKAKYKINYHLAGMLLSSGLLAVFTLVLEITKPIPNFKPELLLDLSNNVINNLKTKVSITNTLTGPLKRADIDTFQKYFTILDKHQKSVLANLMLTLLPSAGLNHEEKDKLNKIFELEKG